MSRSKSSDFDIYLAEATRVVRTLAAGLIIGVYLVLASTSASAYPTKPVTIIVQFTPGGPTDITARAMAEGMSRSLGQPVLVEYKPGATGAIGSTFLAKAPADGYTLMVASIGTFALNPLLQNELSYDPERDFDLITVAVRTPNVLVAGPQFPPNSVAEVVEYMKMNPGKVTFANAGLGTSDHLTAALFMQFVIRPAILTP